MHSKTREDDLMRTPVPGGWLISNAMGRGGSGVTFMPDPRREWLRPSWLSWHEPDETWVVDGLDLKVKSLAAVELSEQINCAVVDDDRILGDVLSEIEDPLNACPELAAIKGDPVGAA